jgi:hypothetical protein
MPYSRAGRASGLLRHCGKNMGLHLERIDERLRKVASGLPSRWGGDRGRHRTADVRERCQGADASLRAPPRCSFITAAPWTVTRVS